jgi:hypothetical protein
MTRHILHEGKSFMMASILALTSQAISVSSLTAEPLRGFGEVTMSSANESAAVFECENPERALILLHKIGRDMSQSATEPATWQQVKLGDVSAPVLTRPGLGSFLPTAKGNVVTVYIASDGEVPGAAFANLAPELDGARFFDPDFRYPVYLDKYSHYGIGSWYPSNWGDLQTKDKPNTVDDHFTFARELDLAIRPNSGGHLLRNLMPKIREYVRPYCFTQWQEWSPELAIMAPEELTTAGPWFSSMPDYYGQISRGGKRLSTWNNWMLQKRVRQHVENPLLVDWPDPNGEVGPFLEHFLGDFSENSRREFVRYLRDVRGYALPSLGQAWHGDPGAFPSWEAVPIPMTWELYGWNGGSIKAESAWRLHPAETEDALGEGVAADWHRPDFDDRNWVELELPGGEFLGVFAPHHSKTKPLWYRGGVEVPADWLDKTSPVYLTAATWTAGRFHGERFGGTGAGANADRVWVNGKEIGAFTGPGGQTLRAQFEVTRHLRPGRNTIAFLPASPFMPGGFFLTGQPREDYPFSDAHRNARYSDWQQYVVWAIADMLEDSYKAIRAIDAGRVIKMHAYQAKDLGVPLAARYGAVLHNTGDEAYFRPWDRRFGYVRGIPSSCESSGSVTTPEHFRRWLGWFSFHGGGPSALDQFHNIQNMMYSPAAHLWREYMPYWKLAPRRDLKKPGIAIFWSSRNNLLLDRPAVYCFDLGRGDLQALGHSYVYVDESAVLDSLLDGYPVVWDSGTWIMDPKTVAGIKEYVERGGTFVALQETGRHTTLQRDAWPISDLTGFEVREIRPMDGTVSILTEQPLFKQLAGRVFYNRGESVDYSDYNFADKCVVLEPVADGTEVLARYDDGAIAIGMRRLGKGRVIVLGSPFWRDSHDSGGMWWPGTKQNAFLEDILAGLGVAPVATADSHKVWREHYLAMNGTEEFLNLHNPYDEPVRFNVDWNTVNPAGRLFDPKDGREIPGTINGCAVRLENMTLAPRETLIVATQPGRRPEAVLADWFERLAQYFQPSAGGEVLERPDLPVYELRLADQLHGKVLQSGEAAMLPAVPAGTGLGAAQSPAVFRNNPDPKRRCVFHVRFPTPETWRPEDRVVLYLRGMSHAVGNVVGPVDAWLNGNQAFAQVDASAGGYSTLIGGAEAEIGKLLKRDAENVLVFTTGPNGFHGQVDIQMRPAPTEVMEIAGEWQMQQDAGSGLQPITLPGAMRGMYAFTNVDVPAAWRGDRVFVEVDAGEGYRAFAINDKVVFHPVGGHGIQEVRYMDVTPWIQFGEANRLTLISAGAPGWQPMDVEVRGVRVQRVAQRTRN